MKNYKILTADDKTQLETIVNNHLADGFILIGGLCIEPHPIYKPMFIQAVCQPTEIDHKLLKNYGLNDDA